MERTRGSERPRSRHVALLAAAAVWGLLSALLPVAGVRAATPTAGNAAPATAPVMLVLDASGSMNDALPSGGRKIDAARQAVHDLMSRLPAGTQLGLETYGTHDLPKAAGCQDVTVLHAPAPLDPAAVDAAAAGIKPTGWTPIGLALQTAAKQLPQTGPRSIVIVTDGADTCAPPDPCQVARDLEAQGADLRAYTIGFNVDDAARSQLTCIAQATGATYTDAQDAGSLNVALNRATQTAIRGYQPAGVPIQGSASADTAPLLTPGAYLDTIQIGDGVKYYAVDIPQGDTLYFSRTPAYSGYRIGSTLSSTIELHGPEGGNCTDDYSGDSASADEASTHSVVWPDPTREGLYPDCAKPGRYVVAMGVQQKAVGDMIGQHVPVEIQIGLEPKALDPGPAGTAAPVAFSQPSGAVVPTAGGGSFGTAATLPGSGRYGDVLQYGENVFYRVHLDWGQGLAWRVSYGSVPGEIRGQNALMQTFNPARIQVNSASNAYMSHEGLDLPGGGKALATPPVRYQNREQTDDAAKRASIDGWYYLTVKLGAGMGSQGSGGGNVPVTLDVAVVGTPGGAPTYAGAAAPSASPGSSQGTGAAGDGVFGGPAATTGATSGAAPATASGSASLTATTAAHSEKSGSSAVWIVGLALVAVGTAFAAGLLYRRGRRSADG